MPRVIMSLLFLTILFSSILIMPKSSISAESKSEEAYEFRGDILIKNLIVSLIEFLNTHQDIETDRYYGDLESRVMELLPFFQNMNSEENLDILVSLRSYYIGEHTNGIYECLLVQKGDRVKSRLMKQYETGKSECFDRFGKNVNKGTRICLPAELMKDRIQNVLARIKNKENCTLEEATPIEK